MTDKGMSFPSSMFSFIKLKKKNDKNDRKRENRK